MNEVFPKPWASRRSSTDPTPRRVANPDGKNGESNHGDANVSPTDEPSFRVPPPYQLLTNIESIGHRYIPGAGSIRMLRVTNGGPHLIRAA